MNRNKARELLLAIPGNVAPSSELPEGQIVKGTLLVDLSGVHPDNVGLAIHRWVCDTLNNTEFLGGRQHGHTIELVGSEVLGRYAAPDGAWVFDHGRITRFDWPVGFNVTLADLKEGRNAKMGTRPLNPALGVDYLEVYVDSTGADSTWVRLDGQIRTATMPVHRPMALRWLAARVMEVIEPYLGDEFLHDTRDIQFGGDDTYHVYRWLWSIVGHSNNNQLWGMNVWRKYSPQTRDIPELLEIWQRLEQLKADLASGVKCGWRDIVDFYRTSVTLAQVAMGLRARVREVTVYPQLIVPGGLLEGFDRAIPATDNRPGYTTAPWRFNKTYDVIGNTVTMSELSAKTGPLSINDYIKAPSIVEAIYYSPAGSSQVLKAPVVKMVKVKVDGVGPSSHRVEDVFTLHFADESLDCRVILSTQLASSAFRIEGLLYKGDVEYTLHGADVPFVRQVVLADLSKL